MEHLLEALNKWLADSSREQTERQRHNVYGVLHAFFLYGREPLANADEVWKILDKMMHDRAFECTIINMETLLYESEPYLYALRSGLQYMLDLFPFGADLREDVQDLDEAMAAYKEHPPIVTFESVLWPEEAYKRLDSVPESHIWWH